MITIRFQKSREERMKDGSVEPGGVDGMCSLTAKFTSAEKTNAADLNQSEKGKSYSSIHWSVSVLKSPKCTLELLSWSRGGVCWMSAYLERKPASTKSHVHVIGWHCVIFWSLPTTFGPFGHDPSCSRLLVPTWGLFQAPIPKFQDEEETLVEQAFGIAWYGCFWK